MNTMKHKNTLSATLGAMLVLAAFSLPNMAAAAVVVSSDSNFYLGLGSTGILERPTGKFDETSFGGFNYWISGKDAPNFNANDQYLNLGDETLETNSIAFDLGKAPDLSGIAFDFSIRHDKGKNYSFSMTNTVTSMTSVLCWGIECPVGDMNNNSELLDGEMPIASWNGLQLQFRAQEIIPSSITIQNLTLTGVEIAAGSDSLFDGTVTNTTPSSFLPFDRPGRIGQWIIGNDLILNSWELAGTVTLMRPDDATNDRTKVRLAVDFVNDMRIPPPSEIPLPAALPLFASALGLFGALARRRRSL